MDLSSYTSPSSLLSYSIPEKVLSCTGLEHHPLVLEFSVFVTDSNRWSRWMAYLCDPYHTSAEMMLCSLLILLSWSEHAPCERRKELKMVTETAADWLSIGLVYRRNKIQRTEEESDLKSYPITQRMFSYSSKLIWRTSQTMFFPSFVSVCVCVLFYVVQLHPYSVYEWLNQEIKKSLLSYTK